MADRAGLRQASLMPPGDSHHNRHRRARPGERKRHRRCQNAAHRLGLPWLPVPGTSPGMTMRRGRGGWQLIYRVKMPVPKDDLQHRRAVRPRQSGIASRPSPHRCPIAFGRPPAGIETGIVQRDIDRRGATKYSDTPHNDSQAAAIFPPGTRLAWRRIARPQP